MRSFVRVTWIVWAVGLVLSAPAFAQTNAAAQFEAARSQEQRVLASDGSTRRDFLAVVAAYWTIVRRFPASGYSDNAVWQAAGAATEAYRRFGDMRDQQTAIRMFTWLKSEYPASSLAKRASAELAQLSAEGTAAQEDTVIRAVQRLVLPEVVRITLELDREVPFYQERLANPARLFFDLTATRTVPPLTDAALRYDDDLVREIRFGRHPNNTTRVVLDLEGVNRYSVFTLYNPYRIVIDCERAQTPANIDASVSPTPASPNSAVSVIQQPVASALPTVAKPAAAVTAPLWAAPEAPPANTRGGFSVARQLGLGISRIVIDPGHGGHDPGAIASGLSEAELVLDVALRLEKLLEARPGVDVVLTRRTDAYVALEERTVIANRDAADLFLSIHANASANARAAGVETYFLNFALNKEAEAVAARENAASGRTMSSLQGIIQTIALNSKLDESRDFAGLIQHALVRGLRPSNKALRDLGVKQAPFTVLIGAGMPSVLAEISFVTNRQEGRMLQTPAYRQKIAEALLNGILRYQQELKKVQTVAQQ